MAAIGWLNYGYVRLYARLDHLKRDMQLLSCENVEMLLVVLTFYDGKLLVLFNELALF